jgi:SEC-C motif-containing protein
MTQCYCCSSKPFSDCCQPLLDGSREASSPEELMRARYSAFCTKNLDFVVDTTDPQARADMDRAATAEWMNNSDFTKLDVLRATDEGNKCTDEFKAYFKMNGEDEIHNEIYKFRKQAGTWFFRYGKVVIDRASAQEKEKAPSR